MIGSHPDLIIGIARCQHKHIHGAFEENNVKSRLHPRRYVVFRQTARCSWQVIHAPHITDRLCSALSGCRTDYKTDHNDNRHIRQRIANRDVNSHQPAVYDKADQPDHKINPVKVTFIPVSL